MNYNILLLNHSYFKHEQICFHSLQSIFYHLFSLYVINSTYSSTWMSRLQLVVIASTLSAVCLAEFRLQVGHPGTHRGELEVCPAAPWLSALAACSSVAAGCYSRVSFTILHKAHSLGLIPTSLQKNRSDFANKLHNWQSFSQSHIGKQIYGLGCAVILQQTCGWCSKTIKI